jgi:hypothetical protein
VDPYFQYFSLSFNFNFSETHYSLILHLFYLNHLH